ncbi:hypothetical protein [Ectobacillus ponti]|uniref:Uncharacterized protein n=1 Tax=Ectobacillus ponti TaxID=2961894 RepID=A0AA41X2X5_9BACI|nr:hypothetical protein [Ectobacillus ponti]MCP8967956.1 hypothetical protein [Ectobacillus ponti]
MKWYIAAAVVFCLAVIGVLNLAKITSATPGEAVKRALATELAAAKETAKPVQTIEVPDSPYTLVVLPEPNRVWVFKTLTFAGRSYASLASGMNLYESPNKSITQLENDKLVFGTAEVPEGKHVVVNGKQLPMLRLDSYFKDSKFALFYKNLYFYYTDKPMAVSQKPPEPIVSVE